jgi:hypothetical protein
VTILISYSQEQPEAGHAVADYLRSNGHPVRENAPAPEDTIWSSLDSVSAAIVIWTPDCDESEWMKANFKYADQVGKLILLYTRNLGLWQIPKPRNACPRIPADDYERILAAVGDFDEDHPSNEAMREAKTANAPIAPSPSPRKPGRRAASTSKIKYLARRRDHMGLAAMPREIFISYRRDDDPGMVGTLYDHLEEKFSKERIFMDVEDGIPPGHDFVRVLEEEVAQCNIMLAVVGKNWLAAKDSRGRSRLENPRDFVRIEIESAMRLEKLVIPVLINKAEMPSEAELPDSMKQFARRHAVRITFERRRADAQGLTEKIARALSEIKHRKKEELEAQRPTDKEGAPKSPEAMVTPEMRNYAETRTTDYFGFSGFRAAIACLYRLPEGASQFEANQAAEELGSDQKGYYNMLHQAIEWGHEVRQWPDPARGGMVFKLIYNPKHNARRAVDPPPNWKEMNVPKTPPGAKPIPLPGRQPRSPRR